MKVLSVPHLDQLGRGESGIHTVIRAYFRHAAEYDIEFVAPKTDSFDVLAVHAGMSGAYPANGNIVAHTHGLYWTGDYRMGRWAHNANRHVIDTVRHSKEVTVPSLWVAETFQRDMRISPHIVPHGIDWDRWQHSYEPEGYIIGYAKNRTGMDVCDPSFLSGFAVRFPRVKFVATFAPPESPSNIKTTGVLQHDKMRELVQKSNVYISTTKETWGIGMLEAMAAGIPVLAFAEGGALNLVRHGETGYLAQPDNYEDLAQGLAYCLQYRDTLSANSRAVAYEYNGWKTAMSSLRKVYEKAQEAEAPTVSAVIPVYNKPAELVIRAIDSVKDQTFRPAEIIVVDDGSTNDVDYKVISKERGAVFITQDNQGVAAARNTGVNRATSKYVVCLDSDDALAERFLEVCVPPLEQDNSLGITYTGLFFTTPDGESGLSPWPDGFDYDKFITGQNQVPTACVFRKEAFTRVGGYHSRYCPDGAGEEDANLWLRISSIGYNAQKVSDEGLFLYSWKSGAVSGSDDHRITDWRYWLPWTRDSRHPFASMAKPENGLAHAVHQYDSPALSIIIPVGDGHESLVTNALDSIEAQTFRQWEAILVWDMDQDIDNDIFKSYPYARQVFVGSENAPKGAGYARNRGAEIARSHFLLFLDADDHLHPECLEMILKAYGETGACVYTDYYGKALIEDEESLATDLRENIVDRNARTGETVIRYKSADYDERAAKRQPLNPPFIWNLVTTLVPKLWFDEVGGFDENMPSWEDVDLWWRLAWAGKPFHRLAEPLVVYRFHTGNRRDRGIKNWDRLLNYMNEKKRTFLHGANHAAV
jgi:glycosyltransferase involved in cell wall biosynthesis